MPAVVNVKKASLVHLGFPCFEAWAADPQHIYIGRDLNFYVKGARKSPFYNPFPVKKWGLDVCLTHFEGYARVYLWHKLDELAEAKSLGCWCHPAACHGDILVRLLQEKQVGLPACPADKTDMIAEAMRALGAAVKTLSLPAGQSGGFVSGIKRTREAAGLASTSSSEASATN
jgi:Domain of unknown function (DUF4326)